jgi:hypothetical protein
LIDTSFIRLCSQRFHGRLGIEENSKRKFKSYYGSEWTEQAMKLDLGQFVYLNDKALKVVYSEDFKPKTRPEAILQSQQPETQPNNTAGYVIIGLLIFGWLLWFFTVLKR